MFNMSGFIGRTNEFRSFIYGEEDAAYQLDPSDGLRFKIGRLPGEILLELETGVITALGSTVEILDRGDASENPPTAAEYRVYLSAAETALWTKGPYDAELAITGSPSVMRPVDQGVILLAGSLPGEVGP